MARKLLSALTLVAALAVVIGCKEDKPTPMNFDAKKAYEESQQKYSREKVGAGTSGATSPTKE